MLTFELLRVGSCCASSVFSEGICLLFFEDRREGIGIDKRRFLGVSAASAAGALEVAADGAGSEGATAVASCVSVASGVRAFSEDSGSMGRKGSVIISFNTQNASHAQITYWLSQDCRWPWLLCLWTPELRVRYLAPCSLHSSRIAVSG